MLTEKEEISGETPPEDADEAARRETRDEDAFAAVIGELKEEFAAIKRALETPQRNIAPTAFDIDAAAGRREEPRLTKEALSKMTQAEIARLDWNEVRRVLSAG
jgi:hypothetical protein